MIPETENPQVAKSVCPGQPVWHAQADTVDSLRRVRNTGFLVERLKLFSLVNVVRNESISPLSSIKYDQYELGSVQWHSSTSNDDD